MKRVCIQENLLRSLYVDRELTISEIAKLHSCSVSKIWANLRKHNITSSRAKEICIPKDNLENLYIKEKLSTRKIAQIYTCGKSTVESKLKKYGIPIRSKSEALKLVSRPEKYKIGETKLREHYWQKELSAYKIAELYNCSPSAIFAQLKRFNIARRTDVEGIILTNNERCRKIAKAVSKYSKTDFNGSNAEKAYLIGFRLGDMYVEKKKYGETVYIASSTTKNEQVELMRSLFERFGHIRVDKKQVGQTVKFQFTANLNSTFDFLLDKKDEVEKWVLEDYTNFSNFLAGYVDAEGSFGVYNGFGSFALGSYDKNIIGQTHAKLRFLGVETESPRIMTRSGYVDKRGVRTLKDLWSIRIRRKEELHKFISFIEPHIKHRKRRMDLLRVKENIDLRTI